MAVVVGEAAVRIRADVDPDQVENDASSPILDALGSIGGKGAALLGGLLGGAALADSFMSSMENEALGDKLNAQLGASGDYAADLGAIAGELYAGAYGENLGEVNDALRDVIQSGAVMEDATNEQLQSVTASAMDLASAFDQDVAGTARAAGRMVQTGLADTAEEALDIITRGFQQGADAGGDLLDVIGEYGTTFSELGLDGAASVGLLNQALAAGIPNADFAADALREMGIIGREGGEEAADALKSLGLNAGDYFDAMQAGGPAAAGALDKVLDSLRSTEDPAVRAAAATALVGTQYEDLGDAILQLDPSEATGSLGQIEGAAASMGETLNDNAQTNLASFWRQAQGLFVDLLGGTVLPIVSTVASALATNFGPAVEAVAGFVGDHLVPVIRDLATWVGENQTPLLIVAGIIAAVFLPHLIALGVQSTIAGAKSAAAWVVTQAGAIQAAAVHSLQILRMIAGWVLMAATSVVQGAIIAASWASGVVGAAVSGAAAMAVQVARVVGGWVLMGAQSLLAAGRMAAAWLIALGPIGWAIAAVIAIVALVVANWETVKNFTIEAWSAVTGAVSAAWEWIKGAVSAGVDFLVGLFMNFTVPGLIISHWDDIVRFTQDAWRAFSDAVMGAVDWVVGFVTGLPGRIWAGLSGLGRMLWDIASGAFRAFSDAVGGGIGWVVGLIGGIPGRIFGVLSGIGGLLVGLGGDLIRGLVNGISGAAGFVGDVGRNVVNSIIGFVNGQVIDRINGLLEFKVAGVTINPPDIPRIPRLHSGGYFDSGDVSGEGLALLRDRELVATPEQQTLANDLLGRLLTGRIPDAATATAAGAPSSITVNEHVYAAPGESAASIAARTTQGVVWNLSAGITRPAPVGATS